MAYLRAVKGWGVESKGKSDSDQQADDLLFFLLCGLLTDEAG